MFQGSTCRTPLIGLHAQAKHCCRIAVLVFLACHRPALAEDGPAPLAEASQRFQLPPGFRATLFAGEPDVVQPIAFTFDDRGRLWVVENLSYPGWKGEGHDRVIILEDRDGDGRFDHKKVFLDRGSNLSAIEWGFGGIWLCSTPHLVFVPDSNRDDQPDCEPLIKLDGWDPKAIHNVTSSLTWGPDGWLYGCNGILSNSRVGVPGSPDHQRIPMNCGVWRYHPTRALFEVVAHGTTNPWGLDFDENGQLFITNCVIQHLWHVLPGARFQRMFGQDFHPYHFALMSSCADHIHWAGGPWQEARGGPKHDSFGGGHAHVGAMIYLGDNWPDTYRQHLFTCNIHGNRVNQDRLVRSGSGYTAQHDSDFLLANDSWFRGLVIKYGPDGGVYISDWSDTGECHNYEVVDREHGRIHKITYGQPKPWHEDLAKLSDSSLTELLTHRNAWLARHARRLLQERYATAHPPQELVKSLFQSFTESHRAHDQLEFLWALHAIHSDSAEVLHQAIHSTHDVVRGWGIQLAVNHSESSAPDQPFDSTLAGAFANLAKQDSSPWVRLQLASALQRIPLPQRQPIAQELVQHPEDAEDRNLALLMWYGIEPLVAANSDTISLVQAARIPLLQQFMARRLMLNSDPNAVGALTTLLADANDSVRATLLAGMLEASQGRRQLAVPADWSKLYPQFLASGNPEVVERGTLLSVQFGIAQALQDARRHATDPQSPPDVRNRAIFALIQRQPAGLVELLWDGLADPTVRIAAIRGLATMDHAETPPRLLEHYKDLDVETRREILSTLASRISFAQLLIRYVDQGSVTRSDLTAFHVQQLHSLQDPTIDAWLAEHWGAVRLTAEDRKSQIDRWKRILSSDAAHNANRAHGRAVFNAQCATCHRLFDVGGRIGPELTGAQRQNLDYVLSNVIDPSAVVGRDYRMQIIHTTDGRTMTGILSREDEHSLTLQTATESVTVPVSEVDTRKPSDQSMMPDGLLSHLSEQDVLDLVAYLASTDQVPLPPSP